MQGEKKKGWFMGLKKEENCTLKKASLIISPISVVNPLSISQIKLWVNYVIADIVCDRVAQWMQLTESGNMRARCCEA